MPQTLTGRFRGEGRRFALVVSRFHERVTARLLAGALDTLRRHGVEEENLTVVYVPGAFELAWAALRLARSGRHHAVVCLGAVVRGATPHFDHVAAAAARGALRAALETGVPVLFGVLTTDTLEQALERAGGKTNKGVEAALAALETADLSEQL